jgi:hypothetical protein
MNVRQIVGPGPCEAEQCQRELQGEDKNIEIDELVRVQGRNYHKGCEPTPDELAAKNRA